MDETKDPIDERWKDPNETAHREARFRDGWKAYLDGQRFKSDTLKRITWENLGWRLARLFGPTRPEMIGMLYDWCVRQQASRLQGLGDVGEANRSIDAAPRSNALDTVTTKERESLVRAVRQAMSPNPAKVRRPRARSIPRR